MDKTTKAFVIAACSVVIATPVVWIGWQFRQAYLIEQDRLASIRVNEEQARQQKRTIPCSRRSDVVFELNTGHDRLNTSPTDLYRQEAWIDLCVRSTAPVDEVANPWGKP